MNEETQQQGTQEVDQSSYDTSELKMPTESLTTRDEPKESPLKGLVPIIVSLLIVAAAAAAIYFVWGQSLISTLMGTNDAAPIDEAAMTGEGPESDVEPDGETGPNIAESEEALADIEADIETTDLDTFDAELDAIEAELDAALSE